MRLSTKGRYAVMAMVDLAQYSDGNPVSLAEIAERQEISLSYLEQLFAMLRKNGLVRSVRGPGGGYLLAQDRGETRIADIILAVDEPIRATRCTPGAPVGCRGTRTRCLTHDMWFGDARRCLRAPGPGDERPRSLRGLPRHCCNGRGLMVPNMRHDGPSRAPARK